MFGMRLCVRLEAVTSPFGSSVHTRTDGCREYMALRYQSMLPFGEQSWHTHSFAGSCQFDDNFRAVRLGLPPVGADGELPRHPILDDNGPRVEFYAYWMQEATKSRNSTVLFSSHISDQPELVCIPTSSSSVHTRWSFL